MQTYYIPKLNCNYQNDVGDDFYEIETYIGNHEVKHNLDDWPNYSTPDAAIDTAKSLSLENKWTTVKVVVHGNYYSDKTKVVSNTTIWDSNVIIFGL